jgi:hypothetical protein
MSEYLKQLLVVAQVRTVRHLDTLWDPSDHRLRNVTKGKVRLYLKLLYSLMRLSRDPSFGYPEHSTLNEAFGSVLISPALLSLFYPSKGVSILPLIASANFKM